MKRFFLLLAILFLPALAVAQNTTVTATVTDPNAVPYAFGTGYASLVCPGNQAPTYNGFSVPRTFTVGTFNGNGTFTQVVYDVSVLVPVGCGYQWHITAQNGTTSFITTIIKTVTGAAVNESAAISASAATLPGSGPSGVPANPFSSVQFNAAGAFGGNSGFTYVPGTPQVDINNASTTSPQGLVSIRGLAVGSVGGAATLLNLATEDNTPWGLTFTDKAAPVGTYGAEYLNNDGSLNWTVSDGSVFAAYGMLPNGKFTANIFSGLTADIFNVIGEQDGTHPANYSFGGNTTPFPITPNTFNLMGPPVASFTAYALQMPSVGPTTANSLLSCITPVSSVSACSFVATPVTGCTTSGGVAFQNGTNNQLTCSAQLRVNSSNGETFATSTNISGTGFLVSNTGAAGPGTGGGTGILGFIQETITGSSPFIPVGVTASVTTQGTGGLTIGMVGTESGGQNGASGTVVSAKAYEAGAFSNTGGGSITNAYGFYADQQTAATNNYSFFSAGGRNDFNNQSTGTSNGVFTVRGVGLGTTLGVPNVVYLETQSDASFSWPLSIHDKTAPADTGITFEADDTGSSSINFSANGVNQASIGVDANNNLLVNAAPPGNSNTFGADGQAVTIGGTSSVITLGASGASVVFDGSPLMFATLPTIASNGCGGSGANYATAVYNTAAFRISVGTSNTGTCTIGMPTARVAWNCQATNLTTKNANQAAVLQTSASNATTVVFQNYTDVMGTHAMTDLDVLSITCSAY